MMDTRKIAVGTLEAAPARRPSAVLISEVLLGELPEGIGDRRPALQGGSRITYRVSSEAFADGIHRTIRRPSGDPLPRSWLPLLVGEPQGEFELQLLLRMDMRSTGWLSPECRLRAGGASAMLGADLAMIAVPGQGRQLSSGSRQGPRGDGRRAMIHGRHRKSRVFTRIASMRPLWGKMREESACDRTGRSPSGVRCWTLSMVRCLNGQPNSGVRKLRGGLRPFVSAGPDQVA